MKDILILGAGRSSSALIHYLLDQSTDFEWNIVVGDYNTKAAEAKVAGHPRGMAVHFDAKAIDGRRKLIENADIVVSMLPPTMHLDIARDCIFLKKHLITASYVSNEMYTLSREAHDAGLIFMGELGLDPGIDHMSAMKKIDALKSDGAIIRSFKSYTGGLIAPESDDNPWHYKFTWNPRNVVLAGQGTAQYLKDGRLKYIPYHRLFERYELVDIKGMGKYEMYANRDSLLYIPKYGLEDIPNILRGTLRHVGFCDAWNALVKLGLTDNSYPIVNSMDLTYLELVSAFLAAVPDGNVVKAYAQMLGYDEESDLMDKLRWIGLFEDSVIGLEQATPAQILEHLLKQKWSLKPDDRDMILMQHEFAYETEGRPKISYSTLIMKGEDSINTAMSKLVGLPLGMFVKQVLTGKFQPTYDVHIPVAEDVYQPVLSELEEYGVVFNETEC
jgi:saccharopine dehydrogenase (NADP+, L-glutamate forming)